MENAQLISLSRQIGLQRQMDVLANNIANMNTTGFKSAGIMFEEYMMPVASAETLAPLDHELSFTQDWGTLLDLAPGSIVQTGNALDVALSGEGFLAVQTAAGERWTRAGALQIDAEGVLVNFDGLPVLGDGGNQIRFDATETTISIDSNGTITTNEGAKGRLRIVEFENPQELERQGDNLFSGGVPIVATATRVVQGAIEKSNVSGVAEMTEMIRVQRAYQSLASLMQRQDEVRREAIKTLGNLNA
jgi:flagellar basal-body rod protein FlgF